MQCIPTRPFFRPGEPIRLGVTLDQPLYGTVEATVYHLAEPLGTWQAAIRGTTAMLEGSVTAEAKRGYAVRVQAGTEWCLLAFDVLDRWTQAPRYGFLFDFRPERELADIRATLDRLLRLHINGLQFYDWQYRHDTLLPPEELYRDPLGRALSLRTVRTLIKEAHARGMAAMPYTAIYAASPEFTAAHPGWQLCDASGETIDFANGFLKIVNPAGPWRAHFIDQCRHVLDILPFDGVHIDQYGEPTTGFDASGVPIDLPAAFADTIAALRSRIGSDKAIVFNLVHNWPLEAIVASSVDFLYSELWPPAANIARLWETIRDNRRLSGRPAVLAVYIPSEWEANVAAGYSTILASGGTHIAHGEGDRYLSDPYFPKAGIASPQLAAKLQRMADFAVAYGEALTFAEDASERWLHHIMVNGSPPSPGSIIVHAGGNRLYVNLLQPGSIWNTPMAPRPAHTGLRLTLPSVPANRLRHAWCASPESLLAQPLASTLELPPLVDWLLVGLEYEENPVCPT